MNKHYSIPSLEVVAIQQRGQMLSGSIEEVSSNVDIQYGGGGSGEPMAHEFEVEDEWDWSEE